MTAFATFAVPYAAAFDLDASDAGSFFHGDQLVRELAGQDFALLLRSVELVVLSQAFSRLRLQYALQIAPDEAKLMTLSLDTLGVIAPGKPDGSREVLTQPRNLAVLLARLLACRETFGAAPVVR